VKIKTEEDARDAERFVEKAARMRNAQKAYFRTRGHMELQNAIALEKEVDEQLNFWQCADVLAQSREDHPELFPEK
jgi:hypothetical protein